MARTMRARARAVLQPAYVLHRRPYHDTSLLLEAFTAAFGRVGLVAKGARRARSPLRGIMQPFTPLLLSWSGRGELATVSAAERAAPLPQPNGRSLLCGLYMNELLMRFTCRHEPHRALFAHYGSALSQLVGGNDGQPVLRRFEKALLEEVGYGLILDHDVETGKPIAPDAHYAYIPERGPVPCARRPHDVPWLRGRSLIALHQDRDLDFTQAREVKELMRTVIEYHLGGRALISRSLFRPRSYQGVAAEAGNERRHRGNLAEGDVCNGEVRRR